MNALDTQASRGGLCEALDLVCTVADDDHAMGDTRQVQSLQHAGEDGAAANEEQRLLGGVGQRREAAGHTGGEDDRSQWKGCHWLQRVASARHPVYSILLIEDIRRRRTRTSWGGQQRWTSTGSSATDS